MSVPRSDTETRSASFWSFNHCLLSFTPSSLACWWFHLLFLLLQNAMLCFIIHRRVLRGSLVTSRLHLMPAHNNTSRMRWSLQVHKPYVHCLLAWFTIYAVMFVCFLSSLKRALSWIRGRVMCGVNAPFSACPPPRAALFLDRGDSWWRWTLSR